MGWKIDGEPFRYEGGADNSADVSHGYRFTLRSPSGETMEVNVEAVNLSSGMSELDARNAVRDFLDAGRTPPERIVMDSEGVFRPSP